MATATSERMMRIHHLDHKYHEGLHRVELINRDEAERRLSLKTLALRDANAAWEGLVSEKDTHILSLDNKILLLQTELSETGEQSSQQESTLQKQRNDIRSLKTDIENLKSSAKVSNSELQDKATLTRELNTLRPELEQLKSQLASHQSIVASNGDLRRQINTLEVELENEKRSKLRAQQADEKDAISDLRSKLQQFENKLNAEKKEKETLKRELTESRGEMEQQKERLNTVKTKLKETQGSLKEAQTDLQKSQRELSKLKDASNSVVVEEPQAKLTKPKEARVTIEPQAVAVETSFDDVDIQTPGNENISEVRQQRRRGTEHALLGEKSNFSITPFLNKSKDATDFADLDSDKSASAVESEPSPEQPRARKRKTSRALSPVKTQPPAASRRKPSISLQKDTAGTASILRRPVLSDTNPSATSGARKRARPAKFTDTVPADSDKENSDSELPSQKPEFKSNRLAIEVGAPKEQEGEAEGRKKKRKLLGGRGKTMFDDDEMETNENPCNPLRLAPAKRARTQLGGGTNAFAGSTFSPLKRERRGVNASFLG